MVEDKTKKLLNLFSLYDDKKLSREEGYDLSDCGMLSDYEGCLDGLFEEQIPEQ